MFHTVPLKIIDLILLIGISATLFLVVELEKYIIRYLSNRVLQKK